MKTLLTAVAVLLTANLAWMIFRSASGQLGAVPIAESRLPGSDATPIPALSARQRALLDSGDASELVQAGFPDDVARQLLAGRAYVRMRAKMEAHRTAPAAKTDFWKNNMFWMSAPKERRREITAVQKEYTETLRTLFGEDSAAFGNVDSRFASLPKEKRELLHRIEQDYGEMQGDLYAEMANFPLPSDQEKLKLLEQEKQKDILAVLSPQEAEEFQLRHSQTAMNIRTLYGDAIETEADYRKIFSLQKAFDDRHAPPAFSGNGKVMAAQDWEIRAKDQRELYDNMRQLLGEEKYAAVRRAADQDFRLLGGLERRLQLPAGTAESLYKSRDLYASQSRAISENPSLSVENRREQLKALAQSATTDFQAALGQQGAEFYAQRSNWINLLKSGSAFSTDPSATPIRMSVQGTSIPPIRSQPLPNVPLLTVPATKAAPTQGKK